LRILGREFVCEFGRGERLAAVALIAAIVVSGLVFWLNRRSVATEEPFVSGPAAPSSAAVVQESR